MEAYDVIKKPVVTERSMDDAANKRYTFKVDKRANKFEIKEAVEKIFSVKVDSVNTMNMRGKKKVQGRTMGYRPDWKKAIVTLSADSKEIKIFEGL